MSDLNILDALREKLPKGSGFDYDWDVEFCDRVGKIKAVSAFTCYNEAGFRHGSIGLEATFIFEPDGDIELERVRCSLAGSTGLSRYWYDHYKMCNADYFFDAIAYSLVYT